MANLHACEPNSPVRLKFLETGFNIRGKSTSGIVRHLNLKKEPASGLTGSGQTMRLLF